MEPRMEKVSLVEYKMGSSGDDGENREVVEAIKMEVGGGEEKKDEASEDCRVVDPIKVAYESDEEESSEDGSSSSQSSSSSSSSSSSLSSDEDEEGEYSSNDEDEEEEDDDNGKVAAAASEVEEGEINGDDLDEVILGSDGEEAVPK